MSSQHESDGSVVREENVKALNRVTTRAATKFQLLNSASSTSVAASVFDNLSNGNHEIPRTDDKGKQKGDRSDNNNAKIIPAKRQPASTELHQKRRKDTPSDDIKQEYQTLRRRQEEQTPTIDDLFPQNDAYLIDVETAKVGQVHNIDSSLEARITAPVAAAAVDLPPFDTTTVEYAPPKLPAAVPEPPMGLEEISMKSIFNDCFLDVSPEQIAHLHKADRPGHEAVTFDLSEEEEDDLSTGSLPLDETIVFNSWDLLNISPISKIAQPFDINDTSIFDFPEIFENLND